MENNRNTIKDFQVGQNVILVPPNDCDVLWIEHEECRFGLVVNLTKQKVICDFFQDSGTYQFECAPENLVIQENIEQEKKAHKLRLDKARRKEKKREAERCKYYMEKEVQGLDIEVREIYDEYHGKCYTCLDKVFETPQEAMKYAYEVQERFLNAQYSKKNKEENEYDDDDDDEYVEIF